MTISVDAEYLEELKKKAKKHDFFEGYIKGIEVAFAFAEELVKNIDSRKDAPQTHEIRTDTHECVKDTHDKDEPQTDCAWR